MELYNLSFWEAPNWQRESTFAPHFLLGVVVAASLLVGVALTSFSYRDKATVEVETKALQSGIESIDPRVKELLQLQRTLRLWETALKDFDDHTRARLSWSPQLAALQKLVPEHILFRSLSITCRTVDADLETAGTTTQQKYSLSINATAGGDDPQQTINLFLDKLQNNPVLGSFQTPHLSDTVRREGERIVFSVVLEYEPR